MANNRAKSPRRTSRQSSSAKPTPTPSAAVASLLADALKDLQAYDGKPYLPTDYQDRKGIPICTGVLDYFPLALLEVAKVSRDGNQQHNPGQPLHWARGKSTDQMDTTIRHIMERGNLDLDGRPHLAKAAWRILAALQIECEARYGLPISRASWEPGREA